MSIQITNKAASSSSSSNSFQTFTNLGLAASVASNALTLALKQQDGTTDPAVSTGAVIIPYRSATSTSGAYTNVSSTAALSVVVPSGATLGTTSGAQAYLWLYAMNNSGATVLGVSQLKFDDGSVQSSTTISSGASANNLIYSTSGLSNVPIRLLGRIKVTETTAGTWATAPSEISLAPAIFPVQTISAYYNTAGGQGVTTGGGPIVINMTTKIVDDLGCVTTGASWQFTAPVAGLYSVSAAIQYSRASIVIANNATYTLFAVISNTTAIVIDDFNFGAAGGGTLGGLTLTGSTPLVRLVAGDFIQIKSSNTNSVGNPTLTTDDTRNWVAIQRVGN